MAQSINLIPKQEIEIQQETKLLSLSTIISFVVLGIVSFVAIVFLIITFSTKNKIKQVDTDIENLRESIRSQSNIEIVARNLDKKFNILSQIFTSRLYYSKLIMELYARKPEGVLISDFSIHDESIEISGKADVYLLVAEFTNTLIDSNFQNGDPMLQKLFPQVILNSVSLESDGASYSITIKYDPTLLKEKQ